MALNTAGFSQEVENFFGYMDDNHIDYEESFFHNSTGTAIEEMNSCIAALDTMATNMNNLFYSTGQYLYKAQNNLESCETANSTLNN